MDKKYIALGALGGAIGVVAYTLARKRFKRNIAPPRIAKVIDLDRYLGEWYNIANYPEFFQKGCVGATAYYSLNEDGSIQVINTCYKGSVYGEPKISDGTAWVVDKTTNAKLKVQFFWPFKGDYWILDVADDYSWAIVGHPNREHIWILSRTPIMDEATLAYVLTRAKEEGYDINKLVWDEHLVEQIITVEETIVFEA